MENLWNAKELPLPPVSTYKAFPFVDIDIEKFHILLEDQLSFFTNYPQLHTEFLLLSRIIYRMKQKFRTSKDFKALEKLTKCLHRYFNLNLPSDLKSLKELLPDNYSDELYLPSRNLVDYILVRLQGVSKLMEYIIENSIDIAHMLIVRIYTGHFWKIGFILFSIVSRIYVLSRHILKAMCNFYSQLLPISKQLKIVGKIWLPENYVFPQNLKDWLEIDLLKLDQNFQKLQETSVPEILNYFNLVDDSDSDVEVLDEYIIVKDNAESKSVDVEIIRPQNKFKPKMLTGSTLGEDIGEIIEVMSNSHDSTLDQDLGEMIEVISDCKKELSSGICSEKNEQKQVPVNLKTPLSLGKIKKKKKKDKSTMKTNLLTSGDNFQANPRSDIKIKHNSIVNQLKQIKNKKFKNRKSKKKKFKHLSSGEF